VSHGGFDRLTRSFSGLQLGRIANRASFSRRLGFAMPAMGTSSDYQRAVEIVGKMAAEVFDFHSGIQMVEAETVFGEVGFLQ
jgi:hypothetical protein